MHVDLFKHYLELTLKVNIFYYAITGAILSFYFSRPDPLVLRWALVFPFIMSVVLAIAACYGARLNEVTRTDVQDLVGRLAWISTDRNSPKIQAQRRQCLTSSIEAALRSTREPLRAY